MNAIHCNLTELAEARALALLKTDEVKESTTLKSNVNGLIKDLNYAPDKLFFFITDLCLSIPLCRKVLSLCVSSLSCISMLSSASG